MSNSHHIDALEQAVSKRKILYSIFDRIQIKKHHFNPGRRSKLDPAILTDEGLANGFPELSGSSLKADLQRLDYLHEAAHTDSLPFLFQKYGWRIAAHDDPEQFTDVAFCDSYRINSVLKNASPDSNFLLVKGDLTGIQEYIYHGIQSGKVGGLSRLSKRLRARSILVSLFADFVANVILRELGLNPWHLLFAGGGHFNLLLPYDKEDDLNQLSDKISMDLRHQFGERLELIVAYKKYSRQKLQEDAGKCFEEVNFRRDELKYRQNFGSLHALFSQKVDNSPEKQQERREREERIGRAFPKQRFLIEIVSEKPLRYHEGDIILVELEPRPNRFHTLVAVNNVEQNGNDDSGYRFLIRNKGNNIKSAFFLAINDTDFLPGEDWKADFNFPVGFGFRFLGKNAPRPKSLDENGREIEGTPENQDADLLDFEQIARIPQIKNPKKGEGFTRLGSLMLDVDNLGQVFSHGLEGVSLARIITLSRELNYFFTAHFNQRAQEDEHRAYIVYSGGDDAFAVGKWDRLMRFAKVLREDFQRFIRYDDNHNDDVHFSAGIFMSNPHYPMGRFYKDTKSLQDRAKDAPGKDSVDVFDYTLGWTSYLDKYDLGNEFREVLKRGQTNGGRKFNASFAYRIMQLVKSSYYERDGLENGQFVRRGKLRLEKFAHNIARMHYLFARNGFSAEDSKKITDELEKHLMHSFLKNAMKSPESGGFEARDYLVALNFAILQIRSSKIKTE